jgi:hypothetical protein
MKRTFIFATVFLSIFLCFTSGYSPAQTEIPEEPLRWNSDVTPSFFKSEGDITYPDFLPRFPSKEDCEKYAIQVEKDYFDDSAKILSLFIEQKYIPADIKKNLIAIRNPKDKPIITIPDLMTRKRIPVRDALMTCWSSSHWSFFYIDTVTSVILLIQKNPSYHWLSDNEYGAVSQWLRPDFADMIQDHSLIEEELFERRPLVVASVRKRMISTAEQEKKMPWGLADHATFFHNVSKKITVFRCDKLLDKSKITDIASRFRFEAKQEQLLAAEQEVVQPQNRAAAPLPATSSSAPPPARGTEEEILAQLAKYRRERDAAEAHTRELAKIESERLKMIASFANVTKEEQKNIIRILGDVYEKNWQNNIDQSLSEISALQKMIRNEDADCRNFAIRMLYSTNPKVIQKIYVEAYLQEKNIENQKCLIESLGWKGDEECIPFLETIYTNKKNPPTLRHAAWMVQNSVEAKYNIPKPN